MVQLLLDTKHQHPLWGPEKIRQRLLNLNITGVPAASTMESCFGGTGWLKSVGLRLLNPHVLMNYILSSTPMMSGVPISRVNLLIPAGAGVILSR
jgi:hypothetical protein